jgi:hypothetical protein
MHRSIEILIGRLITDDAFRRFLLGDLTTTLLLAGEWGLQLSDNEVRGLAATDPRVWDRIAGEIDARLHTPGVAA